MACPCDRTLRSWNDVFPCGAAVWDLPTGGFVLGLPLSLLYGHVCDDRLSFDPLDR